MTPSKAVTGNGALAVRGLRERAVLYQLSWRRWNASTIDGESSEEVVTAKKADRDSASVLVRLAPASKLRGINAAFTALRTEFRRRTLPWDVGTGILRSDNITEFSVDMGKLLDVCFVEVDKFCTHTYPDEVLPNAPLRLGKLHKEEYFPTPKELRALYDVQLTMLPIPDSKDFRIKISDEALEDARKDLEHWMEERVQGAQRDLLSRMLDVTKHFAETMKDADAKFKDSTVTNIIAIADRAEQLTLVRDPQLLSLCTALRGLVKTVAPDTLREHKPTRAKAAKDAAAQVARIERMMKGMA